MISQAQDFQLILHDIHAESMSLSESFQVAALIEKLPQGWKEFKNYLKHKRKEISMDELIVRLRIEEDNRNSKKRAGKHPMESKANVVEHASKTKKRKSSGESSSQGSKGGDNKKYKFNGKCYICDKEGHRAKDCHSKGKSKRRTSKKPAQAHMTEVDNISNGVDDINLSAIISEANLVGNPKEWWVDIGATRHICADKKMFTSYSTVDNGEQLCNVNSSTSKV